MSMVGLFIITVPFFDSRLCCSDGLTSTGAHFGDWRGIGGGTWALEAGLKRHEDLFLGFTGGFSVVFLMWHLLFDTLRHWCEVSRAAVSCDFYSVVGLYAFINWSEICTWGFLLSYLRKTDINNENCLLIWVTIIKNLREIHYLQNRKKMFV